ncbi:putative indole-3-pyruvate monooxygenase [Fulvia fulva]|nr:putative indole-3-pyruvate monooxygenase [Fulvia fulva]KAK4615140.1 putative indole-3-pyruvate monooxygenase [Fulvia fulva]WPV20583.1 putative indole-3-pyruvate monooxygenase [Fulvia fulva]WPV35170.1 putative indole-3-pyruvate monooxygenase [Fulvia fulva]
MSCSPDMFPHPVKTYRSTPYDRIAPRNATFDGAGKTVVITGGATGVGLSVANSFAEAETSRIVIISRSATSQQKARVELQNRHPKTKVELFQGSIDNIYRIKEILNQVGTPDVLVLSAATSHKHVPTIQIPDDEMEENWNINVLAQYKIVMAHLAMPKPAGAQKTIVNVSSACGQLIVPGLTGYGPSKAAFTQMVSHLAAEYTPEKDGVRMLNFHPVRDKNADADKIATIVVDTLDTCLAKEDYEGVSRLVLKDGHWRDHLASSLDFRTVKGASNVIFFLQDNSAVEEIIIERDTDFRKPHFGPLNLNGDPENITFHVSFRASHGTGRGVFRLLDEGTGWVISTVFLSLQELGGDQEPEGTKRPDGPFDDEEKKIRNWQDRRTEANEFKERDPAALVVGAGQAGLMASARLKMLGVDTLAIDTNDRVGENWRRRYHSLVLHDPVYFDQMPYMPFPKSWPLYTPKDKLADWSEAYASTLELNIWTKTKLVSLQWDKGESKWTVELERTQSDGKTEKRTIRPSHIVQCTGHSGKKLVPEIKGMDSFKGDVLCHSSDYTGVSQEGHDIYRDYYEHGYAVKMVQRSSTCVVTSSSITNVGLADADLWLWGMPPELFKAQQSKVSGLQKDTDPEILKGLEKAGFKCDDGTDDSGLFVKYLQRNGGYYIDVGASQIIADGKIKVKHGQEITEITAHGLSFADGTSLEADEIVFATGYQNMRSQARITVGDEVTDRVGDVRGLDKEGEFRTIYRRSGHPGFWFFGGNFPLCRYYSRLLALQIKAIDTGVGARESGHYKVREGGGSKPSDDEVLVLN